MNYNRPVKNDSTMVLFTVCAVVFVAFSFLWLYFFQADLLSVSQHLLSGGKTHYNRTVGAVIITGVLWLLQIGVYSLTRLRKYSHALTYFPSLLLLAIMTSVGQDIDRHFSFGPWYWLLPLLMVLWGVGIWFARSVQPYETSASSGLFSRPVWVNMLMMALMMFGVAIAGNTNAVFHYRTHVETALMEHNYDEALRVGQKSLETDESLMMVRMYALSRKEQLGERLFSYPVVNTSDAMLPTNNEARLLKYPVDSIYRYLGAIPRRSMRPMEYLAAIIRSGQAKPAAVDYLLCGYLIDKNLDQFAGEIGRYYTVNDSLPRHYREALVLYTHQRSNPVLVYHDAVLDVDYEDYKQLEAAYEPLNERKGKMLERYANSYWYYYFYVER